MAISVKLLVDALADDLKGLLSYERYTITTSSTLVKVRSNVGMIAEIDLENLLPTIRVFINGSPYHSSSVVGSLETYRFTWRRDFIYDWSYTAAKYCVGVIRSAYSDAVKYQSMKSLADQIDADLDSELPEP